MSNRELEAEKARRQLKLECSVREITRESESEKNGRDSEISFRAHHEKSNGLLRLHEIECK